MVNKKIKFIAEAGQGHEGSEKNIMYYIKAASKIKIDYLKFHIIFANELAFKDYKYYKFLKKLELPKKSWIKMVNFAKKKNVKISFDVLGSKSLKIAELCKVDLIKLHATDIYNYPLQLLINKSRIKNVILSISGCYEDEVVTALKNMKDKKIICMLGYQNYPTNSKSLNLSKITEMIRRYNVQVGYADHSSSGLNETIYNCSTAMSKGAQIFEKHLTFNDNIKVEDDESAINVNEFNQLIHIVNMCKDNIKKNKNFFSEEDLKYRKNIRRSFYSKKDIKKGEKISFSNICLKRGLNFNNVDLNDVLNKKANRFICKDKIIKKNYFK